MVKPRAGPGFRKPAHGTLGLKPDKRAISKPEARIVKMVRHVNRRHREHTSVLIPQQNNPEANYIAPRQAPPSRTPFSASCVVSAVGALAIGGHQLRFHHRYPVFLPPHSSLLLPRIPPLLSAHPSSYRLSLTVARKEDRGAGGELVVLHRGRRRKGG